jgi:hypothetical protein
VEPAYDLADPCDAARYLDDSRAAGRRPGSGWAYPGGPEHLWAGRVAQVCDKAGRRPGGRPDALSADEALAALTLLAGLRDWLTRIEPALIGAARAGGATWEQLAPVLRGQRPPRRAPPRRPAGHGASPPGRGLRALRAALALQVRAPSAFLQVAAASHANRRALSCPAEGCEKRGC